nr:phosphodiester glycosidase family protein [Paenibacillus puerhi]
MKGSMQAIRQWSIFKRTLFVVALLTFVTSSFLYLTPPGDKIRQWLAETVITTQHRSWAWIFVGAERRDLMVKKMQEDIELAAKEKQDLQLVSVRANLEKHRSLDELIKVEDISSQFYKGKKMYVYDPTTIKIMTPSKVGEGERISSMVTRTGAVAGLNGGAFNDPEGLGNGFAALGMIISEGDIIFTDQDGSIPQHIVGFTKEGRLVVGKYDAFELRDMGVTEAVSFYPRLIANGKPLITSGDGGWGRAPRTVVGQRADGTVIFIVVDGRQSHSVGATLKEMQDLLLEEGCVIAGNLDGGASSELVVDGELVTKPSSRYGERRLPSAFLIYDNPDTVHAPRIWDGVDKIDAGGSYDHPDFLREQAEKKAKQKQIPPASTSTPASTVKPSGDETDKTKSSDAKQDSSVRQDKDKTPSGGTKTTDGNRATPATPATPSAPAGSKNAPPTGAAGNSNGNGNGNVNGNAGSTGAAPGNNHAEETGTNNNTRSGGNTNGTDPHKEGNAQESKPESGNTQIPVQSESNGRVPAGADPGHPASKESASGTNAAGTGAAGSSSVPAGSSQAPAGNPPKAADNEPSAPATGASPYIAPGTSSPAAPSAEKITDTSSASSGSKDR